MSVKDDAGVGRQVPTVTRGRALATIGTATMTVALAPMLTAVTESYRRRSTVTPP
jgi:hypothetical protein